MECFGQEEKRRERRERSEFVGIAVVPARAVAVGAAVFFFDGVAVTFEGSDFAVEDAGDGGIVEARVFGVFGDAGAGGECGGGGGGGEGGGGSGMQKGFFLRERHGEKRCDFQGDGVRCRRCRSGGGGGDRGILGALWSASGGVSGVCAACGFGFKEILGGVDCGVVFGFCGGEVFIFACSEDVEFALGFGAAAADGDAHAVFEGEEVEIFFWDDIAVAVFDGIAAEVFEIDEFGAEEFADGILAEGDKDFFDLGGAFGAFEDDVEEGFGAAAVFGVNGVEEFGDVEAAGFEPGGHFDDHEDGGVSVFIADGIGAEVAVAFFAAGDEEFAVFELEVGAFLPREQLIGDGAAFLSEDIGSDEELVFLEFGADPLEAGEAVDAVDAVGGGDGVLERRGDEGFDDGGVW